MSPKLAMTIFLGLIIGAAILANIAIFLWVNDD